MRTPSTQKLACGHPPEQSRGAMGRMLAEYLVQAANLGAALVPDACKHAAICETCHFQTYESPARVACRSLHQQFAVK